MYDNRHLFFRDYEKHKDPLKILNMLTLKCRSAGRKALANTLPLKNTS